MVNILTKFMFFPGQFGSAVLSYFKFLKWLILLNLLITLLVMGVTTVPQLIIKPFLFNQTINSTGKYGVGYQSLPFIGMSNQFMYTELDSSRNPYLL